MAATHRPQKQTVPHLDLLSLELLRVDVDAIASGIDGDSEELNRLREPDGLLVNACEVGARS